MFFIQKIKLIFIFIFSISLVLLAGGKIEPTYKNISYGKFAKNILDIYIAAAEKPTPVLIFIHGGAFSGGNKSQFPRPLFKTCINNQISFVSINYRLSSDKDYKFKYSKKTPFPPAFEDAVRALQFICYNANKYNIDKKRLVVSGGSAGGGLALWLAFHDDMAVINQQNPLLQESTKPNAVIAMFAQTTYDQEYISNNMNYDGYSIRWINKFLVANDQELKSPTSKTLRRNVSPLDQLDATDKVAIFMCGGNEIKVTPDMPQAKFVHNDIFYKELEKKLKRLKLPYTHVLGSQYKASKGKRNMYQDILKFLEKSLKLD